ncbi:cytochrome P450 [Sanghuangporus baumii]|uniref:Cytochrome P450 n=1 Tax=Sanghuangporus baumii TaxID=108892 RepID=A0A9Q5I3Q9_SANBA|nr:cytochrome P450 [Sanghuangporus baumii]
MPLSFLLYLVFPLTAVLIMFSAPALRRMAFSSSFRVIPGPARTSFVKGGSQSMLYLAEASPEEALIHSTLQRKFRNLGQMFSQEGWQFHRDIVRQYGGVVKVYGLFGDERLTNLVCFGPGIVAVVGEQHRKQRKLLSPVFNVHHLRGLTPIFYRISHELVGVLRRKFDDHGPGARLEIEMLYWLKRTALEIIGQGGLGYSFGPLDSTTRSEYSESVKNFASIGPAWLRRVIVRILPIKRVQRLREIVTVMDKTVRAIYVEKCSRLNAGDSAVRAQISEGRDITSILLRENTKSTEEDKLSDEEILGQMSTLIFAGQDTTSAAFTRILQTLAEHPSAQTRLRDELLEAHALARGDLDYDTLHTLPFLDAVVRETLRLLASLLSSRNILTKAGSQIPTSIYAPSGRALFRTTKDTILPLSVPIHISYGRSPIPSLPLRKNTNVIIAIDAANRRTDIFGPDAEQWRPERWLERDDPENEDNKTNSHENSHNEKVSNNKLPGVYSGLMTFLGGGRSCIGFNFAILEISTSNPPNAAAPIHMKYQLSATETLLAVLIPAFYFELPEEKELAWKLGGIVSPGVKDDPVPKLPLRLSLVADRKPLE